MYENGRGKVYKKYILDKVYEVTNPHKKDKNKQKIWENIDKKSTALKEVGISTTDIKCVPKGVFYPKVYLME